MESGAGGLQEILRVRREKAEKLRDAGWPTHPSGLRVEHTTEDVRRAPGDPPPSADATDPRWSIGGRLTAIRGMGKAMFCDLWDRHGRLQIQLRKDLLGEDVFARCKLFDIGDIVRVEGPRFVTRSGEVTLEVRQIELATKSLYPLPDKHAGLEDIEVRYRQRYLDLAVHEEVRKVFEQRTVLVRYLRRFLDDRGFLEVETPMLHSLIGGAAAKPFITHHNALDMDLYCRIAPELHLKRLLVGGFDRVYEIGRNFRNEGLSTQHNPEFTMLEFYRAWATYRDLMDMTEEMFRGAAEAVAGRTSVPYGEHTIDFGRPFRRISVREGLLEKMPGLDLRDPEALARAGRTRGLGLDASLPAGKLVMELFEHLQEKELVEPTFVMDFPIEVSPLARKKDADPTLADRFELYVAGREIANAFSELNDPDDQRERFRAQMEAKKKGDAEAMDYDEDYCRALEVGMPPAAGEGVGIDRLCMILTNAASIRDVILFPQMRRA